MVVGARVGAGVGAGSVVRKGGMTSGDMSTPASDNQNHDSQRYALVY